MRESRFPFHCVLNIVFRLFKGDVLRRVSSQRPRPRMLACLDQDYPSRFSEAPYEGRPRALQDAPNLARLRVIVLHAQRFLRRRQVSTSRLCEVNEDESPAIALKRSSKRNP